ncbi:hypothetical protein [Natronorubrum halophilum]|uniref:hypothetical protein n=1 Tax=Natronorubrum halophilum TaxID=1702106 RepID=UPI0010C19D01|nr:hypothetical protein [Natronorubrum halophilum]
MSDEHSQQPSSADSAADSSESAADADESSSDDLEPGGGPHRVVSDQSVDDILDSLDETKSASTPAETEPTGSAESDEANAATGATAAGGSESGASTESAAPPGSDDAARSADAGPAARSDDGDASLEDLAARIEDGTVTGADVRAAEAGEGRDSTPDVDEIDLSMEDLETTREQAASPSPAGGPTATDDFGDDAGPLAGSIRREEAGDSSDAEPDEEVGLFGRIKRFFSG